MKVFIVKYWRIREGKDGIESIELTAYSNRNAKRQFKKLTKRWIGKCGIISIKEKEEI